MLLKLEYHKVMGVKMESYVRNKSFLHWEIFLSACFIFAVNILVILQLIPVFESQTLGARIINLIVSPPNFLFEDVFGINSVKFIDYATWILQFVYDYLIALIVLRLVKGGRK